MSYKLQLSDNFQRQAKRLVKKYPSLKTELAEFANDIIENPLQGESLGHHCYKVRLAIASKGKGKSGGARIITHIHVTATMVFLLAIYDKSERDTLSNKEIGQLIKLAGL